MNVYQSRSFKNKVKKLSNKEKNELDNAIQSIINNTEVGTEKKGDLKDIYIHKFKINSELYLLSYQVINDDIELIMLGSHSNYYRDLKSYLKSR